MAPRPKTAVAIPLLVVCAVLGGCKSKPKQPVVLHVLRNLSSPYGSELDHRILDFQGSNPRVSSGQLVVMQSETGDYKDMLQKQTSGSEGIGVIVLDSAKDAEANAALQIDLPKAVNVCAGLKACPTEVPAIIPPQVSGVQREAAQQFVEYLQKAP